LTGDGGPEYAIPLAPNERKRTDEVTEDEVRSLVVRYQGGEIEALELLHARLARPIGAALRRYRAPDLPSTVTRQDLTQQSWIIVAELARRWRPSGSFLAYFFRSFPREVERFLTRSRPGRRTKQAQVVAVPHDELLGVASQLAAGEPSTEQTLAWTAEIASLPDQQRIALVLRTINGSSFDAIGQSLHVSRASAHRLYRRAVARLAFELTRRGAL
jgi:RNA polymerase sigma factor (sigma-70 family)